jgi:hypothetical protein
MSVNQVANNGHSATATLLSASHISVEDETRPSLPDSALHNSCNPFDLKSLRVNTDFAGSIGVTRQLLKVPVRKPNKQEFFRVRQGEEWQLVTYAIEIKEEQEVYLIAPDLWEVVSAESTLRMIVTAMNRQGTLFLWPLKMPPSEEGGRRRRDEWARTALQAANIAQETWVRLIPDLNAGGYQIEYAQSQLSNPIWPQKYTFQDLINIAFKDAMINDIHHPVLRQLRGEE